MLGTVLIVILILALLGALPRWSHSRNWGYVPSGVNVKSLPRTASKNEIEATRSFSAEMKH